MGLRGLSSRFFTSGIYIAGGFFSPGKVEKGEKKEKGRTRMQRKGIEMDCWSHFRSFLLRDAWYAVNAADKRTYLYASNQGPFTPR